MTSFGVPFSGETEVLDDGYATAKGDRIKVKMDVCMVQSFGSWWNSPFNAEQELLDAVKADLAEKQPDARVQFLKVEAYEYRTHGVINPFGTFYPISGYKGDSVDGVNCHVEIHIEDMVDSFLVMAIIAIVVGVAFTILLYVNLNTLNQAFERFIKTVKEELPELIPEIPKIIEGVGVIIILVVLAVFALILLGGNIGGKKGIKSKGVRG